MLKRSRQMLRRQLHNLHQSQNTQRLIMNPQKQFMLIKPHLHKCGHKLAMIEILQRCNGVIVNRIDDDFEEIYFIRGAFIFLGILEADAYDVEHAENVVIDLAREIEEDSFHELTCRNMVLVTEAFCFEDGEEVVEEHVFVRWILCNHLGAESKIIIQRRDDF